MKKTKMATKAVHAGLAPDATGAVVPPIHTTTTFAQKAPAKLNEGGFEYARSGNPTRKILENAIAELENGRYGFAFASGMAAISTIFEVLDAGSHIIAVDDLYGGTCRLIDKVRHRTAGLTVSYIDPADIAAMEAAITPATRMIWVETPTNPLMKLADLEAIAALAKKHSLISVADNTFASPCLQRPLEFGFDIVIHSATKYLNGHSDLITGVVAVNDNAELGELIGYLQNAVGAVLDPFACHMLLRGMKTLDIRMERHSLNATRIADWLAAKLGAENVFYPGLPSHPQYALAKRQMHGFGGMLSIYLGDDSGYLNDFLSGLQIFTLAESLGGVESLICQPFTMTHAALSAEHKLAVGIRPGLLRLSIGIEDADDLIADLEQAFKASKR